MRTERYRVLVRCGDATILDCRMTPSQFAAYKDRDITEDEARDLLAGSPILLAGRTDGRHTAVLLVR
jgi:hypothetical protein